RHQPCFGENEGPGAEADQGDTLPGGPLEEGDGLLVDRPINGQQSADDNDIVKAGRIDEVTGRRSLHATARHSEGTRSAKLLPVSQDTSGTIKLVACQAQRVDEEGECREREGARKDETDLELLGRGSAVSRSKIFWSHVMPPRF